MTEFKVTRRMLGSTAAGGLVAAAAIGAARAQPSRKTFVLVSGSFCGGWIWRRVTDRLEQGGHKVFAPSLTGLGDRSHLLSKDVNLDTHIADVVNLVKWESLDNVCLVAWSYAGFVGAGALESIGNQVSSIVWLDAFLPTDGQKVADYVAGSPFAKIIQTALDKGEAGFGPPKQFGPAAVAERDQSFALSRPPPIRLAPMSSRSSFPERSKRSRRKLTSGFRNFHSQASTRRSRTARLTSPGPLSSCRTPGTCRCLMRRSAPAS